MNNAPATAAQSGLIACPACHLLNRTRLVPLDHHARCSRCGALLHRRKPNSLARVWALTLTAVILYLPANL